MSNSQTTREEWDAMTPDEQWQYFQLMERSDDEFRELLKLIPECPAHGDQCIPHAKQWIREQISKTKENM